MAELTRSEKMLAEKTICLMLLQGTQADGEMIYAYVAVRADKMDAMLKAQKQPDFNPADYGIIVASGYGEPDAATRQRMTEEYGFNHEQMVFLSGDDASHDS